MLVTGKQRAALAAVSALCNVHVTGDPPEFNYFANLNLKKTINLVSLLRRMKSMARVIAYSSALKILALFAKRTALAEFLVTADEATWSQTFEPSVYNR